MGNTVPGAYSVEQLLAEHRWLHRLARSLVGDADADDLLQETWLAALRHPPAAGLPARPWLATVVRNASATFALARRRREARELDAEQARDPADLPEDLVARFQVQRLLAELVAGLGEPFRQTLLLRYYGGHSAADIAAMLGVPAGTVRWRLKRALDELRTRLDERNGGNRARWLAALIPVARAETIPASAPVRPAKHAAGGRPTGADLAPASARGAATAAAALAAVGLVAITLWLDGRGAAREPSGATVASARGPGSGRASGRPLAFSIGDRRASGLPVGAPATGSFVLHGRIIDPGRRPVPGAEVRAYRQRIALQRDDGGDEGDARPAVTGPDGIFALAGLGSGYYNLSASAPGFSVAGQMSIDPASLGSRAWIEITLAPGGAILAGRVLDAGGGPIPGATVRIDSVAEPGKVLVTSPWIRGHTISTDGEGRYQLQLAPSVYTVHVRASGYVPRWVRLELRADQTRDIDLEPGGSVSGRIVAANEGRPLPSAEVFAIALGGAPAQPSGNRPRPGAGWWRAKPTDEEGHFQVGPLSPGPYRLVARQAGLIGELTRPVQVPLGGADAPIEIAVGPGLTVDGTVHANGRPIAGALASLSPLGIGTAIPGGLPQTRTDAAGRFRLGGVLPGEYRLEVLGAVRSAPSDGGDHGPFSTRLLVQRSMTRDVELPRATRVTGVVLTSAGRPAAHAVVEARGYERTRADAAGRFSVQLEPGALPLVARLGDEAARSIDLALDSGQHQEVILTLAPAARISGTVTWEDGSPAATCPITVVPRVWSEIMGDLRSGGDGRFSIDGLPPGEVSVAAAAPDADPAPPTPGGPASAFLALTAGEDRTEVRLVVSRGAGVKDARPGLPPAAPGGAPRPGN
jgi:RNA polymerase sigma factor (sigma-70 family)